MSCVPYLPVTQISVILLERTIYVITFTSEKLISLLWRCCCGLRVRHCVPCESQLYPNKCQTGAEKDFPNQSHQKCVDYSHLFFWFRSERPCFHRHSCVRGIEPVSVWCQTSVYDAGPGMKPTLVGAIACSWAHRERLELSKSADCHVQARCIRDLPGNLCTVVFLLFFAYYSPQVYWCIKYITYFKNFPH